MTDASKWVIAGGVCLYALVMTLGALVAFLSPKDLKPSDIPSLGAALAIVLATPTVALVAASEAIAWALS